MAWCDRWLRNKVFWKEEEGAYQCHKVAYGNNNVGSLPADTIFIANLKYYVVQGQLSLYISNFKQMLHFCTQYMKGTFLKGY